MKKQIITKDETLITETINNFATEKDFTTEKKFKINIWFSIALSIIVQIGLITLSVYLLSDIKKSLSQDSWIMLLCLMTILNIFYLLFSTFINIGFYKFDPSYHLVLSTLSVLTLNFVIFITLMINGKKNGRISWKPAKWKTLDITTMSMMIALYIGIDFLTGLIPQNALFITVSLKYLPLFFAAWILDFYKLLVITVIAAIATYFIPGANADIGFPIWVFGLDYFVPTVCVSLATFFKPIIKKDSSKIMNAVQWITFITIPMLIIYFSKVIVGVYFWFGLAGQSGTDTWGYGPWPYSLVFNLFNAVVDYATFLILIPGFCTTLSVIKRTYEAHR